MIVLHFLPGIKDFFFFLLIEHGLLNGVYVLGVSSVSKI